MKFVNVDCTYVESITCYKSNAMKIMINETLNNSFLLFFLQVYPLWQLFYISAASFIYTVTCIVITRKATSLNTFANTIKRAISQTNIYQYWRYHKDGVLPHYPYDETFHFHDLRSHYPSFRQHKRWGCKCISMVVYDIVFSQQYIVLSLKV